MHQYPWAVNLIKLTQSVQALTNKQKLDSRIVINEESIKEEYIKRGGLLAKYKPTIENKKVFRPEAPTIAEQLQEAKEEAFVAAKKEKIEDEISTDVEVDTDTDATVAAEVVKPKGTKKTK